MNIKDIWALDKIMQHKGVGSRINKKRKQPLKSGKRRKYMKPPSHAYCPTLSLPQMVQTLSLPPINEQPFVDHLEHLQALEREATFLLLAHVAQKQTSTTGAIVADDDRDESISVPVSAAHHMRNYSLCRQRNQQREAASKRAGVTLTFVEFCRNYNLDEKERIFVLFLLLQATAPKFLKRLLESDSDSCHYQQQDGLTVGLLLDLTCDNYREQLEAHRYFSVDGTLVREDLIDFDSRSTDRINILTTIVSLQDSCIRFCLGDHNLYNATFKYIRREIGSTRLDQVILPAQIKQEVIERMDAFYRHRHGPQAALMDEFYGYGTGLAMLFHGPSGTGKTMLAQALSSHFQKQLFYMTERSLQDMPGGYDDIFQTIFREANLHNGIVFFDEADDLFLEGSMMSRELLIALEKSHCVTILATNKPVNLDPAMERRLSMKIAFNRPDARMREIIWKALVPKFVCLDDSVELRRLAEEFQFSGGLIKNTLVMAIAIADARRNERETPILTQEHLLAAANLQLQQAMEHDPLFHTVNEHITLEMLPLSVKNQRELNGLVNVCLNAAKERLPLRFVLHDKTGLGRNVAIALANKCDLKARVIDLSVLLRKQVSGNKVVDPVTQKETAPLDVVFSRYCMEDALLIFNDPFSVAGNIFRKQGDGMSYLEPEIAHRLQRFSGCCCFVTGADLTKGGGNVFDFSVSLGHPETTSQLDIWRALLPQDVYDEARVIRLIEAHPLQEHEIQTLVRRAQYFSLLAHQAGGIQWNHLKQALDQYTQSSTPPVLFGGRP